LQQFATWSAVAGGSGLGATPIFGAEPESCAGPKPPATAIPWKPDTNPILPRPAASTLTDADVTRLRNAYQALRDLTVSQPDDPRGWLEQADKHCWNCGGGLDQQAGEEIHGSWLFLPWHRALLYFHERILGELINDPGLRLAYWDWDNPAHRWVPDAWLTPHDSSNPLWDANRNAVSGSQLPNSLVGSEIMNPIVGASTFSRFGGTSGSAGSLENGPHGGFTSGAATRLSSPRAPTWAFWTRPRKIRSFGRTMPTSIGSGASGSAPRPPTKTRPAPPG
jgi:polyphenol oxidase